MGHDVCFIKIKDSQKKDGYKRTIFRTEDKYKLSERKEKEIAYLRYCAGNDKARLIYKAFHAEKFDGGCSGTGEEIIIDRKAVLSAIQYFQQKFDCKREIAELNKVLKNMLRFTFFVRYKYKIVFC